jgi:hypothetical protein
VEIGGFIKRLDNIPRGKAQRTKAPERKGNGILDWNWIVQNPMEFARLSG